MLFITYLVNLVIRVGTVIICAAAKTVTLDYTKLVHLTLVNVLSTPLVNTHGLSPHHTAFPHSYIVTIIVWSRHGRQDGQYQSTAPPKKLCCDAPSFDNCNND